MDAILNFFKHLFSLIPDPYLYGIGGFVILLLVIMGFIVNE